MSLSSLFRSSVAVVASTAALVAIAGCGSTNSSQSALEEIKSKGEIVVGTEGTYAPFTYHDSSTNELTGYDVDVIKAIAKELGVTAKFEEANFDSLLAGLDTKKYDTVANEIGTSDERKQKYDFSDPYSYSYGVIVTTKDNNSITSFEDLAGKKAAETMTSNWNATAQKYGAEIVQINDFSQAVDAITSGRADATVNDGLAFLDYMKQKPDADIKAAVKSESVASGYLPFRKSSDDLVKAVNDAIAKLQQDGTLAKISETYFGEDISKAQ